MNSDCDTRLSLNESLMFCVARPRPPHPWRCVCVCLPKERQGEGEETRLMRGFRPKARPGGLCGYPPRTSCPLLMLMGTVPDFRGWNLGLRSERLESPGMACGVHSFTLAFQFNIIKVICRNIITSNNI